MERSTIVFPFRDKQRDWPRDFCCQCGQEQYAQDPPLAAGLCWQCREGERKREERERGERERLCVSMCLRDCVHECV